MLLSLKCLDVILPPEFRLQVKFLKSQIPAPLVFTNSAKNYIKDSKHSDQEEI